MGPRYASTNKTGFYLAKLSNPANKYFLGKVIAAPILAHHLVNQELSINVSTLSALPTGTHEYYIHIITDYKDEVFEIKEDNNELGERDHPFTITREATDVDENSRTDELTSKVILYHNFPNPSNPSTTIQYTIPETDKVLLKIFDIKGKEIQTLINASQTPGLHSIIWDGKDQFGRNVSSGIYFYRLETRVYQVTRKMLLIR